MMSVVIALIVLAIAVGAIYWLLKSMREDGIEVAAPGSCKSGRRGIKRCSPAEMVRSDEDLSGELDGSKN